MFLDSTRIWPVVVTLPYRSLIRLEQRSSVVLPHPDGPIRDVMMPGLIWTVTFLSAWNLAYQRFRWSVSMLSSAEPEAASPPWARGVAGVVVIVVIRRSPLRSRG